MLISEIYSSKQGEGLLTGQQSVFVRTSGCNLRCEFCDTPFTSWEPEGENREVEELVNQIVQFSTQHIVITGGEPMLQKQIVELTKRLADSNHHITIETAGTIDQPVSCDLMSISPKMSNSTPTRQRAGSWREKHEATRIRSDVVRKLIDSYSYQLKFVVKELADIEEIEQYLEHFDRVDRRRVLLMPEGITQSDLAAREPWLLRESNNRGFTFCPRKHIEWYGNKRGT